MQASSSVASRQVAAGSDSNDHSQATLPAGIIVPAGAIFAGGTALAAYLGYLWMFTGFRPYDDEGFMLVSLRSFISGQALYDNIVVQYGPFYFEVFRVLGALGVPFDNDSGRLVTLAVWLAIALSAGVAVFIFSRNLAVGISTQLITFGTLVTLTNEPMHPGGLVLLLVVGIIAVALVSSGNISTRWPCVVMGALAAAAVLTKVNVGGFAAISIAFACVLTIPALARTWAVRLVASSGFVVVPFLLMRADLSQDWVQRYGIDAALSALALVVATSASRPDSKLRLSALGWLFAGGATLTLVVLGVALFSGTSPSGLLHGIVLNPLQQAGAFELPLRLPSSTLAWNLIGIGGATLWTIYRLSVRRPEVAIEGGVRLLVGAFIWLTLLGGLHIPGLLDLTPLNQPLALPLSLAWVVAAPRGSAAGFENLDFSRALVPAIAILQSLHAFPVAGSQQAFAAVFLVPVGAICISDGLLQLGLEPVRRQLAGGLLLLGIGVSWLPATWHQTRAAYASSVPLGLPGASLVRVPADQALLLQTVTQTLRDNCDTFISVPGLDSFYIFGPFRPPAPPTRWIWLANDWPHETAVVAASNHIKRLCVIENDSLTTLWLQGRSAPSGPLPDYIRSGFVPAYSIGPYTILVRPS
jgi:hypothetical protein